MCSKSNLKPTNPKGSLHVAINFCSCGFDKYFDSTKQFILDAFPEANIEGKRVDGEIGIFDVVCNGVLIHSKLGGDGFVTETNKGKLIEKMKMHIT